MMKVPIGIRQTRCPGCLGFRSQILLLDDKELVIPCQECHGAGSVQEIVYTDREVPADAYFGPVTQ